MADFVGHGAVHHALVEIGSAQAPDLAGEHDVVAVVHFREVIEGAGLLGKRQHILAAVVFDVDVAFFDVDIGRAVFAHGAELDQVALGLKFAQREQQVERAHHVIHLREDRVLAVDHGVRRGALFGKVNHRFGLKRLHRGRKKIVIGDVAGEKLDGPSGVLLPDLQSFGQRANRRQGFDAELVIP